MQFHIRSFSALLLACSSFSKNLSFLLACQLEQRWPWRVHSGVASVYNSTMRFHGADLAHGSQWQSRMRIIRSLCQKDIDDDACAFFLGDVADFW